MIALQRVVNDPKAVPGFAAGARKQEARPKELVEMESTQAAHVGKDFDREVQRMIAGVPRAFSVGHARPGAIGLSAGASAPAAPGLKNHFHLSAVFACL